jgi:hypothetical protein
MAEQISVALRKLNAAESASTVSEIASGVVAQTDLGDDAVPVILNVESSAPPPSPQTIVINSIDEFHKMLSGVSAIKIRGSSSPKVENADSMPETNVPDAETFDWDKALAAAIAAESGEYDDNGNGVDDDDDSLPPLFEVCPGENSLLPESNGLLYQALPRKGFIVSPRLNISSMDMDRSVTPPKTVDTPMPVEDPVSADSGYGGTEEQWTDVLHRSIRTLQQTTREDPMFVTRPSVEEGDAKPTMAEDEPLVMADDISESEMTKVQLNVWNGLSEKFTVLKRRDIVWLDKSANGFLLIVGPVSYKDENAKVHRIDHIESLYLLAKDETPITAKKFPRWELFGEYPHSEALGDGVQAVGESTTEGGSKQDEPQTPLVSADEGEEEPRPKKTFLNNNGEEESSECNEVLNAAQEDEIFTPGTAFAGGYCSLHGVHESLMHQALQEVICDQMKVTDPDDAELIRLTMAKLLVPIAREFVFIYNEIVETVANGAVVKSIEAMPCDLAAKHELVQSNIKNVFGAMGTRCHSAMGQRSYQQHVVRETMRSVNKFMDEHAPEHKPTDISDCEDRHKYAMFVSETIERLANEMNPDAEALKLELQETMATFTSFVKYSIDIDEALNEFGMSDHDMSLFLELYML